MVLLGDHKKLKDIIDDYKNGLLGGIIMSGVNPVYSFPDSIDFKSMLSKIDFSLSFSMKMDETSVDSKYVAACPHYLESWGDFEFINGEYSLCQPTIKPLFDTRQFEDCLIKWSGSEKSYYDEIRTNWESNILKNGTIWNKVLHDGIYSVDNKIQLTPNRNLNFTAHIDSMLSDKLDGFELIIYSKPGMGDGQQANNPWLQEFPDPISRVSWDNYLTISKFDLGRL